MTVQNIYLNCSEFLLCSGNNIRWGKRHDFNIFKTVSRKVAISRKQVKIKKDEPVLKRYCDGETVGWNESIKRERVAFHTTQCHRDNEPIE